MTDLRAGADGRTLVSACEDGLARVWEVAGARADDQVRMSIAPPADPRLGVPAKMTAARPDPSGRDRMAVACWSPDGPGGEVWVASWTRPRGEDARWQRLGLLDGEVHALAFSSDGRELMAAGDDRKMQAWSLPDDPATAPSSLVLDPVPTRPHHDEQVQALAAWPDRPHFASGGDDASARLWRLDPKAPKDARDARLGTLIASGTDTAASGLQWLACTPSGVFDGSLGGDRLARFVLAGEVRALEQYDKTHFRFGLTDEFRRGASPAPVEAPEVAALAIDPLPKAETEDRPAVLEITLADPSGLDLDQLRLYQNGVPIREGPGDFTIRDRGSARVASARVLLRSGENRFYAMAARPDGIDARSGDVAVYFNGPDRPGKTHVVALGVSSYGAGAALRFAHADAKSLGAYLHDHGALPPGAGGGDRAEPGVLVTLTDRQVDAGSVEEAFTEVRRAMKGHPEDTIVVFLAGHTDLIADRGQAARFCLLLPEFPFAPDAPLVVGMRGVDPARKRPAAPGASYLPYSSIYRELTHLDAQQRLVIVDACQAEAIVDDPGVRRVRALMEKDARRTRNAYYFAARAGEPAGEDPALEHGLLTYVMLWGLGATDLKPPRGEAPGWRPDEADADANKDRVISTAELRSFVDRHLPELNARLPELATRSGRTLPPRPGRDKLSSQGAQATFPVVALPRP